MKKAATILGTGLLAVFLLSFISKDNCPDKIKTDKELASVENHFKDYDNDPYLAWYTDFYFIEEIEYLDDNEEIDLGFDTADYLPNDFDPYKGMELDLSEIDYIELEEEIVFDFDTKEYLPVDFNPYANPTLDLNSIFYLEDEAFLDYDIIDNTEINLAGITDIDNEAILEYLQMNFNINVVPDID